MIDSLSPTPKLGTWPATQACALAGNRTRDILVCGPVLDPLSHTSHGILWLLDPVFIWRLLMGKLRYRVPQSQEVGTGFCVPQLQRV